MSINAMMSAKMPGINALVYVRYFLPKCPAPSPCSQASSGKLSSPAVFLAVECKTPLDHWRIFEDRLEPTIAKVFPPERKHL